MSATYENDLELCEICRKEHTKTRQRYSGGTHQICPRCGEFKITGTAEGIVSNPLWNAKRAILSGWIRSQNMSGFVPTISATVLDEVIARPPPSVMERANGLLIEAGRGLNALGDQFNVMEPRFLAATYSSSSDEVLYLLRLLEDLRFAKSRTLEGGCEILPAGYIKLDELRNPGPASTQGFIAMWFDASLNDAYDSGLQAGVFQAGYDPVRIDRVEHVNRIDDEIIRQINASKFLVADFSGHRGGVYFEAGYALGRSLPVFWTCRKQDMGSLHFDIRQFNCIDWASPEELANRLATRIEAVLGPGPRRRGA